MSESNKPFVPFWATKQYVGGLLQGVGLTLFSLFLLNSISPSFFARSGNAIGTAGIILLVLGGLQARRSGR